MPASPSPKITKVAGSGITGPGSGSGSGGGSESERGGLGSGLGLGLGRVGANGLRGSSTTGGVPYTGFRTGIIGGNGNTVSAEGPPGVARQFGSAASLPNAPMPAPGTVQNDIVCGAEPSPVLMSNVILAFIDGMLKSANALSVALSTPTRATTTHAPNNSRKVFNISKFFTVIIQITPHNAI